MILSSAHLTLDPPLVMETREIDQGINFLLHIDDEEDLTVQESELDWVDFKRLL